MKINAAFNADAHNHLSEGVEGLLNAVGPTYGPNGRVFIDKSSFDGAKVVSKGSEIAACVLSENPLETVGAELISKAASRANSLVGDGTKFTVILAASIYIDAVKLLAMGYRVTDLISGIEKARKIAENHLENDILKNDFSVNDVARNSLLKNSRYIEPIGESLLLEGDDFSKSHLQSEILISSKLDESSAVTCNKVSGISNRVEQYIYRSPKFLKGVESAIVGIDFSMTLDVSEGLSEMIQRSQLRQAVVFISSRANPRDQQIQLKATVESIVGRMESEVNLIFALVDFVPPSYRSMKPEYLLAYSGTEALTGPEWIRKDAEFFGKVGSVDAGSMEISVVGAYTDHPIYRSKLNDLRPQFRADLDLQENLNSDDRKQRSVFAKFIDAYFEVRGFEKTEHDAQESNELVRKIVATSKAAMENGVINGVAHVSNSISHRLLASVPEYSTEGEVYGYKIFSSSLKKPLHWIAVNNHVEPDSFCVSEASKPMAKPFEYRRETHSNDCKFGDKSTVLDTASTMQTCLKEAVLCALDLINCSAVVVNFDEEPGGEEIFSEMARPVRRRRR